MSLEVFSLIISKFLPRIFHFLSVAVEFADGIVADVDVLLSNISLQIHLHHHIVAKVEHNHGHLQLMVVFDHSSRKNHLNLN
jgi:hypothetical protein